MRLWDDAVTRRQVEGPIVYFFPFWDRCNNMEFSGPRWAEYEAHLYVTRPTASFHFAIASPSLRRSHFLTHPSPPLRRRRLVAVDAAARHRAAALSPLLRALPATAPPPLPRRAPRAARGRGRGEVAPPPAAAALSLSLAVLLGELLAPWEVALPPPGSSPAAAGTLLSRVLDFRELVVRKP